MSEHRQMDLFTAVANRDRVDVAGKLTEAAGRPVRLRITRNRVSMAWVDFRTAPSVRVSLDEAFLAAPDAVMQALYRYLRSGRSKHWRVVAEFAQRIPIDGRGPRSPTASRGRQRGRAHELRAICADINREFFGGRVTCNVRWGRDAGSRRKRRRSIRFGSWDEASRTIRVHPLLDGERVPREFVRYIVFHEMLHAVVPAEHRGGRCYHHTAQYRALERQFPDLPAMKRLGRQLLEALAE